MSRTFAQWKRIRAEDFKVLLHADGQEAPEATLRALNGIFKKRGESAANRRLDELISYVQREE